MKALSLVRCEQHPDDISERGSKEAVCSLLRRLANIQELELQGRSCELQHTQAVQVLSRLPHLQKLLLTGTHAGVRQLLPHLSPSFSQLQLIGCRYDGPIFPAVFKAALQAAAHPSGLQHLKLKHTALDLELLNSCTSLQHLWLEGVSFSTQGGSPGHILGEEQQVLLTAVRRLSQLQHLRLIGAKLGCFQGPLSAFAALTAASSQLTAFETSDATQPPNRVCCSTCCLRAWSCCSWASWCWL